MRSEAETRKLAKEHWIGFTGGLLEIALSDPVPKEVVLKLVEDICEKVWVHAVKHRDEEADG